MLQNLNENADAWATLVKSIPFTSYKKDVENIIPGTLSVYVVAFIINTGTYEKIRYYVGQGNAIARSHAHKSEYLACKTTTRIGKSKLYTNEFLEGAITQRMEFIVFSSGHDSITAKKYEQNLCKELILLFGDDVITKPIKLRTKNTSP
jgi:hypothetical protein